MADVELWDRLGYASGEVERVGCGMQTCLVHSPTTCADLPHKRLFLGRSSRRIECVCNKIKIG